MQKLKRLALKKEVIANLSDNEMNRFWGGYTNTDVTCGTWIHTNQLSCITCFQDTCPDTCIDCPDPCEGCAMYWQCIDRTRNGNVICPIKKG